MGLLEENLEEGRLMKGNSQTENMEPMSYEIDQRVGEKSETMMCL